MQRSLSLIGTSWSFITKQPILGQVAIWMLFVPLLAINELEYNMQMLPTDAAQAKVFLSIAIFLLSILLMWGVCAVLIVGKRLLAAKSGRSRSSLKVVMREARSIIIPVVLTGFLRSFMTALWTLAFIIPGILYLIRTSFHIVIIALEGIAYFPALRKSQAMIKGHTLSLLMRIVGLMFYTIFAPTLFVNLCARLLPDELNTRLLLDMLHTAIATCSITIMLLSLILLYGELRPHKGPVMGGGKKK